MTPPFLPVPSSSLAATDALRAPPGRERAGGATRRAERVRFPACVAWAAVRGERPNQAVPRQQPRKPNEGIRDVYSYAYNNMG